MKNLQLAFMVLIGFICNLFQTNHNGGKNVAGMALIKLSGLAVTSISGKSGGTVFSRNRGGAYAKNFSMPSNTFSEFRQSVRALFGAVSSAWRLLSEQQRQSFTAQAPNYPVINRVGDSITLSGNALHNRLNINIIGLGLPPITTALPPEGTNGVLNDSTSLSIDIGDGDSMSFVYGLEQNNDGPDNYYVLEATPGLSPSIKNVSNQFRVVASTPTVSIPTSDDVDETNVTGGTASDMLAAYVARFGTPPVGSVVHIRMKAVNPRTGEEGSYWYDHATVVSTDPS